MDLYIGYGSESNGFLLGYCNSSHAVRSEAVRCSWGDDKLLPRKGSWRTQHQGRAASAVGWACHCPRPGSAGLWLPMCVSLCHCLKLFQTLWVCSLFAFGAIAGRSWDNTCSLGSSVLTVSAEHYWWRSWSRHRAAWAAAAAVPGVRHMISLRVYTHPTSCSSKKVPPEPATGIEALACLQLTQL